MSAPTDLPADPGPAASPARAWALAVGLLALALIITLLANALILARFPDRPRPNDLLFELLPYVSPIRYLTVAVLVLAFGLFLVGIIRRDPRRLPAAVSIFAIMYLLRAGIIVLTPLASAQGERPFVFSVQQFGMFPSGHVGAATLLVLLTPATPSPASRRLQQILLVATCLTLLLARGHYSIDIVGGLLLGYFVAHAWRTSPVFRPIRRITGP